MQIREPSEVELEKLAQFPSAAPFRRDRFLVLFSERQIVSFLAWRAICADEFEILHLETVPAFRRQGFARVLLHAFVQDMAGSVFLEVRGSNAIARQLYEKQGFVEIGKRRQYYTDPFEDAIVLKFRSC